MTRTIKVYQGSDSNIVAFGISHVDDTSVMLDSVGHLCNYKQTKPKKGFFKVCSDADMNGYYTDDRQTFLAPFKGARGEVNAMTRVLVSDGINETKYAYLKGAWQQVYDCGQFVL